MNMTEQTNPEVPQDDEGGRQQAPGVEIVAAEIDLDHVKRVLEAALLSSTDPLTVQQLKRLFSGQVDADTIRKVLEMLKGSRQ